MGEASVAVSYAVFAILFVTLNIQSTEKEESAQIFETVTAGYNNLLYSEPGQPMRRLSDISSPEDLQAWLRGPFMDVTFQEQTSWNISGSNPWGVDWSANVTPANVGGFNRVLLIRFSMKRWRLEANSRKASLWKHAQSMADIDIHAVEDTSAVCIDLYQDTTTTTATETTSLADGTTTTNTTTATTTTTVSTTTVSTTVTDTTTVSSTATETSTATTTSTSTTEEQLCYPWSTDYPIHSSGGYTIPDVFVNPLDGRSTLEDTLTSMDRAGFFDLRLANMVVDMMVYNANVDQFMHIMWEFNFDFAGNCDKSVTAKPFNLNIFNTAIDRYLLLFVLRIVLMAMVLLFFILEIRKMCDVGLLTHFKHLGSVVDIISLCLCAIVLLSYFFLQGEEVFSSFNFDNLFSPVLSTQLDTYKKLETAAASVEDQSYIVAFNLLMVSVRAVVLVAGLQSKGDLGLILKVLDVSFFNLLYFILMFLMIMTGFVLMAYFTFGAGFGGMSTPFLCFYQTFAMLTGRQVYDEMEAVDGIMAPIFYYVFYILFYLVMINMFISILLSGYDIADFQIKQGRKKGEKQPNPFVQFAEEFRREIVGRFWTFLTTLWNCAYGCLAPILLSFMSCLTCCPSPSSIMNMCLRKRGGTQSEMTSQEDEQAADGAQEEEEKDGASKKNILMGTLSECTLLLIFMTVFISMMSIQTRGTDTFFVSQVTLHGPAKDTVLDPKGQINVDDGFEKLRSFVGVSNWARYVLLKLYETPLCVSDHNGLAVAHDLSNQVNISQKCPNEVDGNQIVQVVGDWNLGFLNTTFVRLTIQPSCLLASEPQWAKGQPLVRITPAWDCAENDCVDKASQENTCYTSDGYLLKDMKTNPAPGLAGYTLTDDNGAETYVKYNYSRPAVDLGSYLTNGGYVFSFGTTRESAEQMLDVLLADNWFTTKSASMVFDWITYNGNLDMFTYNKVAFSLLQTGLLKKTLSASTIPLNVDEGGGEYESYRVAVLVLFGIYCTFVVYYIGFTGFIWFQGIKRHGSAWKYFVQDFITDIWNITDTMSLVLSIISIFYFIAYLSMDFRRAYIFDPSYLTKYAVPNDDVKLYNMSRAVDATRPLEDDMYIFRQFERATDIYGTFLTLAATNSFFISIKVAKYAGKLPPVQIFSNTLRQGQSRNIYFALIIVMALLGFALFFHIIFGHQVMECDSISNSVFTLFNWMIGDFNLEPFTQVNLPVATVFFVIFMVGFYFIAVNMFLATMLNTYSETVADLNIKKEKKKANANRGIRLIEYKSKDHFATDVELAVKETKDGQLVIYVAATKGKQSMAELSGVEKGHVIIKVNGMRNFMKSRPADGEEAPSLGVDYIDWNLMDDKEVRIHFKDPEATKDNFMSAFGLQEDNDAADRIKPTVKNFWRTQGAITWIAREVQKQGKDLDEMDGEGDEEGGADDESGSDAGGGPEEQEQDSSKVVKARVKRRLDGLLFSRWGPAKRGQEKTDAVEVAANTKGNTAEEVTAAAILDAENWDVEDLRERIEGMPVTGEEAWLDCLVTAIEQEVEDESIITELLRTSDMQEVTGKKSGKSEMKSLDEFYKRANEVLEVLECKASKKYYQWIQQESESHQEALRKQNDVLHDYVCELEKEFTKIMEEIHKNKAKKEVMLTKLAGLLDTDEYAHLDHLSASVNTAGGGRSRGHAHGSHRGHHGSRHTGQSGRSGSSAHSGAHGHRKGSSASSNANRH